MTAFGPPGAALVIVGDGTADYARDVAASGGAAAGRPHVLPLRRMLNGSELRTAYAAADLFCSASNFETLGSARCQKSKARPFGRRVNQLLHPNLAEANRGPRLPYA